MIVDRFGNVVVIIKETSPDKAGRIVVKEMADGSRYHDYLSMLTETEPGELDRVMKQLFSIGRAYLPVATNGQTELLIDLDCDCDADDIAPGNHHDEDCPNWEPVTYQEYRKQGGSKGRR